MPELSLLAFGVNKMIKAKKSAAPQTKSQLLLKQRVSCSSNKESAAPQTKSQLLLKQRVSCSSNKGSPPVHPWVVTSLGAPPPRARGPQSTLL